MSSKSLKAVMSVAAVILISLSLLIIKADILISKIVFQPKVLDEHHRYNFNFPFRNFYLYPEENIRTDVVQFSTDQPKGAILYFHGNKDNLERWGGIAQKLTEYGYDVFVIDYRGYGKSTGIPTTSGILRDAESLFEYIQQNHEYEKLFFYGRSLGSGVAAWLAERYCPDGVILETPYYSLGDLIESYYPLYVYHQENRLDIPSWLFLQQSDTPVLILHGTDDRLIPLEDAIRLYDSLHYPDKKLVIMEGGTHDNLSEFDQYAEALKSFLNRDIKSNTD